ncbi:hypothetical protein NAL89_16590 [Burkholderia glumae]|nr:hypothetical protein [Burkholderia glumae]KHJ60044.1 hypothetical protein NCPPB3923_26140 [Burkholderia glumae]MCQ0033348.1 hypothetical protein [Burkholderia glumae]MCQ0038018.1 hypothetical protein [Burkholderia glumae]
MLARALRERLPEPVLPLGASDKLERAIAIAIASGIVPIHPSTRGTEMGDSRPIVVHGSALGPPGKPRIHVLVEPRSARAGQDE